MNTTTDDEGRARTPMTPRAAGREPGEPSGRDPAGRAGGSRLPLPLAATAGLLRGPADLLDFMLPLWVGAQWGLPAAVVGALVAVEAAASLLGRPVAGVLVDRGRPGAIAAAGAALYAVSFALYATAGHPGQLFASAVVGGIGGALAWVALRALTGAAGADRGRLFSDLVAAEGTGTWVAFVVGLTLLPQLDYRGVFAACAVACTMGAGLLVGALFVERRSAPATGPGRPRAADQVGPDPVGPDRAHPADRAHPVASGVAPAARFAAVARRMRLLLVVVTITAAAETGVGLLMLLHLQRGFSLDVGAIAAAFLPGFILYSLAPPSLNRIVRRRGRTPVLVVALGGSAVFAVGLAVAPNPWVISGLWILAALSWAAAAPIEQAVVADAAPFALGRGLARYETATLGGVLVGGSAAGLLYDTAGGWWTACLVAAGGLVLAAALAPAALSRTGQAGGGRDHRSPDPVDLQEPAPAVDAQARNQVNPAPAPADPAPADPAPVDPATRRFDANNWLFHLAVWTIAQVGLAIAGYCWPVEAVLGGPHEAGWWWNDSGHWLLNADRIWTALLVLDTAYTGARWLRHRTRRRRAAGRRAVAGSDRSNVE